ncbi:MAG: zinc-binding dehydrogenase [Hyphomicrobiales bacterium]
MSIPVFMAAVQLLGHGGYEQLHYNESVRASTPGPGEVLIRVKAAGINNTDINTRIGWYSASKSQSTSDAIVSDEKITDGDWTGKGLAFPRIQGADVCGEIVGVGDGVARDRLGERVIVQSCLLSRRQGRFTPWLGSEYDGGFAQYVCAPAADTYRVRCDLSDAQLAAIPCAYGTAENLLGRAGLGNGEVVLITGASGNVGLAACQLARLRGAQVIAIVAPEKFTAIEAAGAHRCLARDMPLMPSLKADSIDVIIDVVGGPHWPELLDVIAPGAIRRFRRHRRTDRRDGPAQVYLKDLSLFGCTAQHPDVFGRLVCYLEAGQLKPLVAREYRLEEIVAAQEEFLSKKHVGKIVLIPPGLNQNRETQHFREAGS